MMNKKGAAGLVGAVVGIAIAAVVAVITVQIYGSVLGGAGASINGTTKTVANNIPVFIFLGLLVAAAMYFAMR